MVEAYNSQAQMWKMVAAKLERQSLDARYIVIHST